MNWIQKELRLRPRGRGFHLITAELEKALPELSDFRVGVLHLFIQHTSASLTINENADPSVRADLEEHLSRMAPDGARHYTHTVEGADDMPAHIKASLMGPSLTIPISEGELKLGTWQGVYLCEHRREGGSRRLVATLWGESSAS